MGMVKALIDLIKDCKLCILNGWLDPLNDNFTYISDKGKSVLDYIITPHNCLDKCGSFKVHTMYEVCVKYNLAHYISHNCKLPYHSIVHVDFKVRSDINPLSKANDPNFDPQNDYGSVHHKN